MLRRDSLFGVFLVISLAVFPSLLFAETIPTGKTFWLFESGQVRPLALSPDGTRLFAVNTPDNHLEIFDVTAPGLVHVGSVPVGLEPVAVAARSNSEVWVVNHLSDSISIIDVSTTPAIVTRTLLVGDEPMDIVFGGTPPVQGAPFPRAFVTTAHRGQAHNPIPFTSGDKYGEFFTPSVGRADVWVFDANNLGSGLGGLPETILTLFGDSPRALAVTPNGDTVYAAIFHSGNKTTISPQNLQGPQGTAGFGITPNIPTIVKFDGADWRDFSGNVFGDIQLQLPDIDVFEIDATAATPVEIGNFAGVGTILFNMAVDPSTSKLYVTNTEANNHEPNEPDITGELHRARITVIDPAGNVSPRRLNKHIDYSIVPSAPAVKDATLANPMGMAISNDGNIYVAAFGSSKIGVFTASSIDDDSFTPGASNHIAVSGGGPSGLVIDETNNRLYVLTRFDNGISVIDRATNSEISHQTIHNPEPPSIVNGRPFLYDAQNMSSNGEASCSSCHVFGRMDDLAWDLSETGGTEILDPNPFANPVPLLFFRDPAFHPMKGPMVTQSFRGMAHHGPLHWRADRSGELSGSDFEDTPAAFAQFNPSFVSLLGRDTQLSAAEMQAFSDFILQLSYPPNPIRNIDNTLTDSEAAGQTIFFNQGGIDDTQNAFTCGGCHSIQTQTGNFGTRGLSSFQAQPQNMKIPHLRNMYQKVGMFGAVPITSHTHRPRNIPSLGAPDQPQIRGFGYTHDGTVDSLLSFTRSSLFSFSGDLETQTRQVSEFMLTFRTGLAPVVGQQVTLSATNVAAAGARIDTLLQRAQVANPGFEAPLQMECDLIAQGVIGGAERSWLFNIATNMFESDYGAESPLTDAQLRSLVTGVDRVTYTCAPPGSGTRMALDRDSDGLLNRDEVLDLNSDPASVDSDGDGLGDNDEVNIHGTDPGDADTDGDGLDDATELATTLTDPLDPDSDDDGISDGDEVTAGSNPNDAAPQLTILSPADNASQEPGAQISLSGSAIDDEDGDISANIQWASDVSGVLGSGNSVLVSLDPGAHVITATVTDSENGDATASINVLSLRIGDINGDGAIDVIDLIILQNHLINIEAIGPPEEARADTYPAGAGDGQLDVSDLLRLQQLAL
ncbi:MAG: dockerin type I domain-containing protein [Gammaproteobacteria bacterium]